MNNGFFLVYRKLFDHEVGDDPLMVALWVKLLATASYEDKDVIWDKRVHHVKRGEMIISILKLSKWLRKSDVTTKYYLNTLKDLEQIKIKTTNKYTVISIQNWDRYQLDLEQTKNKLRTNLEQIKTTNKYNKVLDNKLSNRRTPSGGSFGNAEIEKILADFKSLTGHIPADKYPRRVAQHMRQSAKGFVSRVGAIYLRLRGEELTTARVYEKFWGGFAKKKYSEDVEKLDTVLGRFKVYLDDSESKLREEVKAYDS